MFAQYLNRTYKRKHVANLGHSHFVYLVQSSGIKHKEDRIPTSVINFYLLFCAENLTFHIERLSSPFLSTPLMSNQIKNQINQYKYELAITFIMQTFSMVKSVLSTNMSFNFQLIFYNKNKNI